MTALISVLYMVTVMCMAWSIIVEGRARRKQMKLFRAQLEFAESITKAIYGMGDEITEIKRSATRPKADPEKLKGQEYSDYIVETLMELHDWLDEWRASQAIDDNILEYIASSCTWLLGDMSERKDEAFDKDQSERLHTLMSLLTQYLNSRARWHAEAGDRNNLN